MHSLRERLWLGLGQLVFNQFWYSPFLCSKWHWHFHPRPKFVIKNQLNKGFHLYHFTWSNTFPRGKNDTKCWVVEIIMSLFVLHFFPPQTFVDKSGPYYNGFTIKRLLLPLGNLLILEAWYFRVHFSNEIFAFFCFLLKRIPMRKEMRTKSVKRILSYTSKMEINLCLHRFPFLWT